MLRVLTYHRILEPIDAAGINPSLVSSTPVVFDQQMRHLAKRYRVVSAEEVLGAMRDRQSLPERAVLLTFDDAYRDFGEIAWPILRRYGLPATLFVPTAYPDHPDRAFWWDRLHHAFAHPSRPATQRTPLGSLPLDTPDACRLSLNRMQNHLKTIPHAEAMEVVDRICAECGEGEGDPAAVLSWDELRALAKERVTLGAHTRTHPVLTQVGVGEARAEIRASRDDLRREIGVEPFIFCYPFGAHNDRVVEVVREEGCELAVTCVRGQNDLAGSNPLRLRRTNVTPRSSPLVFRLRMLRSVSHVDAWNHRRRQRRRNA